MSANRELIESIKQDVMAELQANRYPGGYTDRENCRSRQPGFSNLRGGYNDDQSLVDAVKRQILLELEDEFEGYRTPVYDRDNPELTLHERAIAESIKKDVLAEMEARQTARYMNMSGYGDLISDRNLNRMISNRYQSLSNTRTNLRRELQAIEEAERRMSSISDPHLKEAVSTIVHEAREQGVPLEEVIRRLGTQGTANMSLSQRIFSWLNNGQRRGFVYGTLAGMVAAMLMPSARRGLHSVAVKTMESGLDFAERTRSMFDNAQEDLEDQIQYENIEEPQNVEEHRDEIH